jgi:peroxiredoxin
MGTQAKHLRSRAVLSALLAAGLFLPTTRAAENTPPTATTISLTNVALDQPAFGFVVFHTARGAVVAQVFVGSPADRAGLSPGDLLVSGNEVALAEKPQAALLAFLAARPKITFLVRQASRREVKLTLEKDIPRHYAKADGSITARAIDLQLSSIQPGTMPPDFSAQTAEGKTIKLSSLRGQPVVVVFWATWCLPCFAELQTLKAVYAKLHPRGLEIIGVSLDEDREKFDAFRQQNHVPWPQQFDGQGWNNQVAQQWTVERLSATVLVNRNGRVVRVLRENLPAAELRAAIESLLP